MMRKNGVSSDGYTFPVLNKLVVLLETGGSLSEVIHCLAMQMGFESDVYFCNTMIEAYVKSGCFENALKVFGEMTSKDMVSWTTMISGYAYEGNADGVFALFNEMRKDVKPNEVTMIVMLQTCSSVVEGRQLHGLVIKSGFLMDQSLKNSFLKMYAGFGRGHDLEMIFDEFVVRDVVSWNILISLHSSKGNTMTMVDCFNTMRCEKVEPNIETLTLLTSGLAECGNPYPGRKMHCLALKFGLFDDILKTSLLNLYANSGDLEMSAQLFRAVSQGNCSTWVAMRSLVVVCEKLGALRFGKAIHAYFIKNLLSNSSKEEAQSLETSILNMYVKCGNISSARICFDKMIVKDLVTWTSMIEGCGTHGLGAEAFELFHQMKSEGIEPNSVTFLSLLSASSHCGLLHEGCGILNSMKWEYAIEPGLDHYTCIVDLLGRCGKIKEALSIILKLVDSPDSRIWAALLAAARVHKDQRIGKYAAEKVLLDLESDNAAGYYTLFSNVQASFEKWDEVEKVRKYMKDRILMKHPGWSCLEVKGIFERFVSGDRSHHQMDDIYRMIECLSRNAVDNLGNALYSS
ncbi:hypothetical protein ACJIZ3_025877 [Penstemon smallii]|uniref:Pentatricopeptide repeat-containing protein n=1 Tax=Penstemon smallii TaxID=265156 RepID=A0ABD3TX52_9LAMI